jgi:sporulation protein YlmC with PRC-barrel domain
MASTAVSVLLLLLLALSQIASAQVVGTVRSDTHIVEDVQIASGWSAKESILGQNLFNDAGENVGRIEDLIVDRERNVSYLVVGVGGVAGMGRHAIAIPASQIRVSGDRLVLPGATRIALAALPRFVYVPVTRTHSSIVARAESDVDRAKRQVVTLNGSAINSSDVQRSIIEGRISDIKRGQREVEAKISEMIAADGAGWKAKELEVAEASARLRTVIRESN